MEPSTETPYPEPRWPALISVLTVILIGPVPSGKTWPVIVLIAILSVLMLTLPRWHAQLGYANSTISTLMLGYALYDLLNDLLIGQRDTPVQLLANAVIIWTMNILVFATWYWRLDAGGPHHRSKHRVYRDGAFLFPQVTLPGNQHEEWKPRFVDYLFLSFNTSTAFSPTDVPVLSRWAKVLMMVQSSISLTTLAIVAARAVNTLGDAKT